MTGRPLKITQRQVEAICKGAAKAGLIPEININGTVIRLVHTNSQVVPIDDSEDAILDRELEAFKVKHGYS